MTEGPRLRAKICGIGWPEDAELAVRYGAWAVGAVFAPASRRAVDPELAREIYAAGRGALRVAVFLDASASELDAVLSSVEVDAVQLHGRVDDAAWAAVPAAMRIRALPLRSPGDIEAAVSSPAAQVLVDRPRDKQARAVGRVSHDLLAPLLERRPGCWVAGGLTPENVELALAGIAPGVVDVAGGVESQGGSPGERPRKDPEKVRQFVAAVERMRVRWMQGPRDSEE